MSEVEHSTVAPGGTTELVTSRPTFAGELPPVFAQHFDKLGLPTLPEFCRLPAPKERCPLTGASRTWLVEHDQDAHFLVRIRQRRKQRGAVFVNLHVLLGYLRKNSIARMAPGGRPTTA